MNGLFFTLLLLLFNIFLLCSTLEIPINQDESITETETIFDKFELPSNRYSESTNTKFNNEDVDDGENDVIKKRTKRSSPRFQSPEDAVKQGYWPNANGDDYDYIGYIVDIGKVCIYNEDCDYPYTCQYTVMGRRCIKDLTIEYPDRKFDGIPTIDQLEEEIFNKTFDIYLPWNQE